MPGLPGPQAGEAGGGGEGLCLPGGKVRMLVEMVIRESESVLCKLETTVIVFISLFLSQFRTKILQY